MAKEPTFCENPDCMKEIVEGMKVFEVHHGKVARFEPDFDREYAETEEAMEVYAGLHDSAFSVFCSADCVSKEIKNW